MNLFLHNIGELDGGPRRWSAVHALISEPKRKVDLRAGQSAFWQESSMTITNEEGEESKEALTYEQQVWETTSNKQLNFLQHIVVTC